MEKLIKLHVIDSERGETTFQFFVLPMTSVGRVMRKLGLDGFTLINLSGKPVPYDADLYEEAEKSSARFLALYSGITGRGSGMEGELFDD